MQTNIFTIKIEKLKPRNTFVALANNRKAGSHRKSEKTKRSNDKIALRKEID